MKKLSVFTGLILSALTLNQAEATFLSSPALSCHPSGFSDAGFSFVVENDSGKPVLLGELSRITFSGSKSLGSEEMVIRNIGTGKNCDIQIKQRNDVHGNEFRLVIQDVTNSFSPQAKLDLKLNGKPIDGLFKNMTCMIDQGLKNRVCKTSFNGPIYHNQNNQGASGVSSAR